MRAYITAVLFSVIIGGFFLLNLIVPKPAVLTAERRKPADFPALTQKELLSGDFITDFESYANDRFVFRDQFRELRAASVFGLFMQTDKDGLYFGDAGAGKFEAINEDAVRQTAAKIGKMAEKLSGVNVYYSFVPDKSVFAGKYLPGFNVAEAKELLSAALPDLPYVDIASKLSAGDFYRTDLHWNQIQLSGVLNALGEGMNFADRLSMGFESTEVGGFEGVYPGQLALPMRPDQLTIITDDVINNASVRYLSATTAQMGPGEVYDAQAIDSRDAYDVFLQGSQPLIEITNTKADTDRELYLFRDSFGSSLAPLLASAYKRIWLIDLRYLDSRALPAYVEFQPGSDALFLYSSQVLNHPEILLVN
jgi:hypothetical protein